MSDMMTIYMFYANDADIYHGRERKDTKNLYAITNKKKIRNQFKCERNMEYFIEKKTYMTKDQYKQFAFDNRECVLEKSTFQSVKDKKYTKSYHDFSSFIDVPVICTYMEIQIVKDDCENFMRLLKVPMVPSCIFTKEIRSILSKLQYQRLLGVNDDNLPFVPDLSYTAERSIDLDNPDYSAPEVWVDEFSVFTHHFGHLFI